MHDQNFIEHNSRHFFLKLYIRVHIHVMRIPALVNQRYTQVSTQHFLTINTENIPLNHTIYVHDIQRHKGLANL